MVEYRKLGNTDLNLSSVSMGCWAIGGSWGHVSDDESMKALHAAVDAGVNFFDTADVYGDGRSERLVGRLLRERSEEIYVATKAGRRLSPHAAGGYNAENLSRFLDRSLENLNVERVDLLQLHCPPSEVYETDEVFEALQQLQEAGKIRHYGVSIEKVSEGLSAMKYDGVKSIQVIFNAFRQKPTEELFARAIERGVGILARVPLASGLLTGKLTVNSAFEADDHRNFNRHGEAFDVGETFSGVRYELGLRLVEELRPLVPEGALMSQWALRFILNHPAVTCVIPGAKSAEQIRQNVAAAGLPPLSASVMERVKALYGEHLAPLIHEKW
jgi:aryl-alcohol dehydrogenase-like predicted oxidoreductase